MTVIDTVKEAKRRRRPAFTDHDWLVQTRLASAILEALPALGHTGARVLDFGAGCMPYRDDFLAAGYGYIGADIDGSCDIRIDADGRLPLADASVDAVVSFQVLEHVADIAQYLAEARRVLRSDGRLLLSTHGSWPYHPHPTDYRRWTRDGLILDLGNAGFGVDSIQPVVGPFALTTVYRLIGYTHALKAIPVAGRPIAALFGAMMNTRALIEDSVTPREIREQNACVYVILSRPFASGAMQ
jgi:SAM-dependent methyltransferase